MPQPHKPLLRSSRVPGCGSATASMSHLPSNSHLPSLPGRYLHIARHIRTGILVPHNRIAFTIQTKQGKKKVSPAAKARQASKRGNKMRHACTCRSKARKMWMPQLHVVGAACFCSPLWPPSIGRPRSSGMFQNTHGRKESSIRSVVACPRFLSASRRGRVWCAGTATCDSDTSNVGTCSFTSTLMPP